MAADNYVHDGINDFYDPPTADTVVVPTTFEVGDPILVGDLPAIALSSRNAADRTAGKRVIYTTQGRFRDMLVDATAAITYGSLVYFQTTASRATHLESTATATNVVWGVALGTGATGAARTIDLLLGAVGGATIS